jgi:hypothetical protein
MSERFDPQETEGCVLLVQKFTDAPFHDDHCVEMPVRSLRILMAAISDEIEFRAQWVKRASKAEADNERLAAELAAAREREEVFADLAQLVLDRITDGATNEERYLMKDTARIAMQRYRAARTHGQEVGE